MVDVLYLNCQHINFIALFHTLTTDLSKYACSLPIWSCVGDMVDGTPISDETLQTQNHDLTR